MSSSLLCSHVGCYCMENLDHCIIECVHECTREWCYCSITGCPPVRSLADIKGGWEALAEALAFRSYGLHFLLSPSWSWCSPFQQKMLEENLRVTRKVPATSSCNPNALIGSILDIMSLHIPMRQGFRGWVASSYVILLGFPVSRCPRIVISGGET